MFNPLLLLSAETWLLVASIILLSWVYVKRKLSVLERLNIPSLEPGFLGLSAIRRIMSNPEYVLFKAGLENRKKYGKVFGEYMFLTPVVTIWDPDVLKQVLIKEFSIFPDRQKNMLKIQGEMNDALLSVSGPQWKRSRTTLTPTFSSAKLREMLVIVQHCGDKLIESLINIENKKDGIFDSKVTLGRFTMDVICAAAFGGDFHVQEGDDEPDTAKIMRETIAKPMTKNPIVILTLLFGSWFEKLVELTDYSVFGQKFRDHVNGILNAVITEQHRTKRTDMMRLMLKNEISEKEAKTATKGLTRREIFGNSQLMIFAGYETTSTALMFLLYNLAIHQDCQEELREQLQCAMDRHEGELSYETINDIKYLNMCINESLRLYPPAPMNQRCCEKDVTIQGHHFVKGLMIQINMYAMSHDEEYWDEPYSFKPERMEDMSKIDPMIFQPFGAGPRNCIGMRFALMVLKLAVCKILINFEILPTENTPPAPCELKFGSTVAPKENIVLKIKSL